MNKMKKTYFSLLTLLTIILAAPSTMAKDFTPDRRGGDAGVYYPLICVDFSGQWCKPDGSLIEITQEECKKIDIQTRIEGGAIGKTTLLTDNQTRIIPDDDLGDETETTIRHKWNSLDRGDTVKTYIYRSPHTHATIYEEQTLSIVTGEDGQPLLRQATSRLILMTAHHYWEKTESLSRLKGNENTCNQPTI